jgi:predicted small lipoprotein YifL
VSETAGIRTSGDPMRRRVLALLALGLPAALGACGRRGPLRLPEPPPASPPESGSSAKASDKEAR